MKKSPSGTYVSVDLGEDFQRTLKARMRDEYKTASAKWGVELSPAERKRIMSASLTQLEGRVATHMGAHWSAGDPKIRIVAQSRGGVRRVSLPGDEGKYKGLTLVRVSNGWSASTDPVDCGVPMSRLPDFIRTLLLTWASTAVFYGVGSHA